MRLRPPTWIARARNASPETRAPDPVDAPCPVHDLEDEIREKTGYQNLYHELEFFGTCPKCA